MQKTRCPTCSHETAHAAGCPACGRVAANGAAGPTPPPEVAGWRIEHASPDILAWAAQTFDETAFLAAKREIEQGGGVQIDDLIDQIEREINGNV